MIVTITPLGGQTLLLPEDLTWVDQFQYSPVAQTAEFAVEGAVIVDAATKTSGREITLQAGDNYAWFTLSQINALRNMAYTPGKIMTLTIGQASFKVVFRHNDPPAIDVVPLVELAEYANGDYFFGTIKFLEVA